MSLCTKLGETFPHLRYRLKSPLSDEGPIDPSKAPIVEEQQPREPVNPSAAPTLLTLPVEIRSMIYIELGLSHNTFHLVESDQLPPQHLLRPRRLRHFRCTRPLSPSIDIICSCLFGRRCNNRPYDSSAPLLLVCRQFYLETVPILYAQNIFDFGHYLDNFTSAIGPQSLRTIRQLRIRWPISQRKYRPLCGTVDPPTGGTALEECVRTLREDMGTRLNVTVIVNLASQSHYFSVAGLWAGKWWLEPLARLRGCDDGDGAARMKVHVVVCELRKEFADVGAAWEAFQEEVERLVRRGEGVQSSWVELEEQLNGPLGGFLCVPGRFGRETLVLDPESDE